MIANILGSPHPVYALGVAPGAAGDKQYTLSEISEELGVTRERIR